MASYAMVPMGKHKTSTARDLTHSRGPVNHGHTAEGLGAGAAIGSAALLWYLGLVPTNAAAAAVAVVLAITLYIAYESRTYGRIMAQSAVDIDEFASSPPSLSDRVYISVAHRFSSGSLRKSDPIELCAQPSPYIDGLLATSPLRGSADALDLDSSSPTVIVGSIRMGFGHHRIARAAASWGVGLGLHTYFHDLLAIDSPEAELIKRVDHWYSRGSRLATEIGGPVERAWGAATLSGGANTLRQTWLMGEALTALVETMPRDVPIVCSHSLVGMVAVAAGFRHVVNCVIDNHAQWFVCVPGAVNLVQGPANYQNLLAMGVPPSEVRLAGHWVPKELVDNIEEDTAARLERCKKGDSRRLLMPIGGAGAQKRFVTALVRGMAPYIRDGRVELFLNSGDRAANHDHFDALLRELGLDFQRVEKFDELKTMIANPDTIKSPVVLLAFKEYFPALGCTDMLMRICDVLVSKPSELAFYPIPKLTIRRVGDHEGYSALRAVEVGDGVPEARTVEDALRWVELLTCGPDLFKQMNNSVLDNHSIGMYNGARTAVEIARKMARGEAY